MGGIERLVRDAELVGTRIQNGGVVHARALIAPRGRILHAGRQVLRIVLRQADALVLLRIR